MGPDVRLDRRTQTTKVLNERFGGQAKALKHWGVARGAPGHCLPKVRNARVGRPMATTALSMAPLTQGFAHVTKFKPVRFPMNNMACRPRLSKHPGASWRSRHCPRKVRSAGLGIPMATTALPMGLGVPESPFPVGGKSMNNP
jgi:hypothetical protein